MEELLLKERTTPSPFSVPPVPIVPRCSGGSCQDAGNHRQIAGRIGDDEVRSGLRDGGGRRRRRYGGRAAHNTACHHRRARELVPVKAGAARYRLRGTREASHPGPRRRQVIPRTDDDMDSTFLDEFELDLNAPTDSRRSPGAHEQMSPCGCPPAPEAFVLSDDEHLRTPAPSVCVPTNVSTVPAASGELREARRAFFLARQWRAHINRHEHQS